MFLRPSSSTLDFQGLKLFTARFLRGGAFCLAFEACTGILVLHLLACNETKCGLTGLHRLVHLRRWSSTLSSLLELLCKLSIVVVVHRSNNVTLRVEVAMLFFSRSVG